MNHSDNVQFIRRKPGRRNTTSNEADDSSTVLNRRYSSASSSSSSSSSCSGVPSSSSISSNFLSMKGPGYFAVVVIVVIITLQFSSPVLSASLNKRSIEEEDVCRTNAICGWEVYHPSTRNLQYYVASSCKCLSAKETCIRSEDDVSISAYVFRCRDPRKRKGSRRPDATDTSS